MKNQEIAKILHYIAQYLEMDGVAFKPFAYEKAALVINTLEQDIEDIYKKGGIKALEGIPGIGQSIAQKIEEYLKTGKIKYYEEFRKKMPTNLEEIVSIEGVGPKKAKILYQKLEINNLEELKEAAELHRIAPLFGFGEKTEKSILEGIAFLERSKGRFLLGEILPVVKEVQEKLKSLKEVEEISPAGSVRRMKETIGDVDFLVVSKNPGKVMDFFVSIPGVIKVWEKGATKASVRMSAQGRSTSGGKGQGFDMDIRVVPKKSYGAALQYFTGSKEHNISLRKIAIDKGLKLNEYGLFSAQGRSTSGGKSQWKQIAGEDEKEVYKALGLSYIEPEMREDKGEIEAALKGTLPKIIGYNDIKGDLHCHSDWDGGENSIEEMAEAAKSMGHEYIGISDHTKFLKIENGLDERKLEQRNREIDRLNLNGKLQMADGKPSTRAKLGAGLVPHRNEVSGTGFKILKGCEANILPDGLIDIKDEALKKLDFVIAGVHSALKTPKEKMTERIIRAMRNPNVDIISHPTGRILKRRDEYQIDFDKILRAARETKTILEINSYPERLDLNDQNIRRAKEAGVKMAINTDSHEKHRMRFVEFGVAQARRGWAEKEDIINTKPLNSLMGMFKKD